MMQAITGSKKAGHNSDPILYCRRILPALGPARTTGWPRHSKTAAILHSAHLYLYTPPVPSPSAPPFLSHPAQLNRVHASLGCRGVLQRAQADRTAPTAARRRCQPLTTTTTTAIIVPSNALPPAASYLPHCCVCTAAAGAGAAAATRCAAIRRGSGGT